MAVKPAAPAMTPAVVTGLKLEMDRKFLYFVQSRAGSDIMVLKNYRKRKEGLKEEAISARASNSQPWKIRCDNYYNKTFEAESGGVVVFLFIGAWKVLCFFLVLFGFVNFIG